MSALPSRSTTLTTSGRACTPRWWPALLALLATCLALAACGGGGGGGSSGPPPIPPGTFTLSASSASFHGLSNSPAPAAQSFQVSITGSGVAVLGVAYGNGQTQPPWLSVALSGSGTAYTMTVSVQTSGTSAGSYSSTFQVGTVDSAGKILTYQNFTVNFTVDAQLAITTPPVAATFIFGDLVLTQSVPVAVTAAGRSWTLSPDVSWLTVQSPPPQSGSGTATAVIDATKLAPGNYTGHLTATNSAVASDTASLTVTVTVVPAALSVLEPSYAFGGSDGRAAVAPLPVTVSLSTGAATYPYTATVTTTSGGAWLSIDHPSGTIGASATTLKLNVNPAGLKGASYQGQLQISTTVAGQVFTQTRPVSYNVEAHRLVVSSAGVGLSQSPVKSVLSRSLTVYSTLGSTTTAWRASSDSAWLSVTASGSTGGTLTLTANPAGLPQNASQYATVTVSSADPSIENTQTIRVGLYLASAAPGNLSVPVAANVIAASPVDPIVAVGTGGASIGIYDINTGALLRTLSGVVASSGDMVWSEDGTTLYVHDTTNLKIQAVNPQTGVLGTRFEAATPGSGGTLGRGIAYLRPNGYALLMTPGGIFYELGTSTTYTPPAFGLPGSASDFSRSPDESLLAADYGTVASIVRSALSGGALTVNGQLFNSPGVQGSIGQSCFSTSGDRLYTASGAPYSFTAMSTSTGTIVQTLPGTPYPGAIQCVWNGVVIGGVQNGIATLDLYVYNGPSGASLATLSSNGSTVTAHNLITRGMTVSADGSRLVTAYSANGAAQAATAIYFQSIPTLP